MAVPDLGNPYYTEILDLTEEQARSSGYAVLCSDFRRDPRRLEETLHLFRSQRVDGVLIAGGAGVGAPDLDVLARAGIPVVVVGRYPHDAVAVRVDNVQAGRLAARHLVERGHRFVAFLSGPDILTTVQDRLHGFREICDQAGVRIHLELGDFKPGSAYWVTRRILTRRLAVTAICGANDQMAIGAMAACADAGAAVPADVAVMGFDDIPLASFVRPSLTTVAISARALGWEAGRLLLSQIDGLEVPRVTSLDVRLIERDSTTLLPRGNSTIPRSEMHGGVG